ncbi:hypothetical protein L596_013912 [Steinernema carpocapsae]|uniref:TIL domain-containing protein n=1 Tax=Steinernema carpocapsae TaxID=34508 RepID=A0A4U5P1Q6_STECR|nr:hypothetical protein L596_013912 [Steinernema carpocapsae]
MNINRFYRGHCHTRISRSTFESAMFRLLLVSALVLVALANSVDRKCPAGEYLDKCGGLCEATCENPFPVCTKICKLEDRCTCNKGLVRSVHGNCVSGNQCVDELNPCNLADCATGRICLTETSYCKKAPCAKKAVCVPQSCFA